MTDGDGPDEPRLLATQYADGRLTIPGHPRHPISGAAPVGEVDLTEETARVLTWTRVEATPPGVRQPNTLAIVEFDVDGQPVRVLGGTTGDVAVGDELTPVHVEQLRAPDVSIRSHTDQPWSGFRFEPPDE